MVTVGVKDLIIVNYDDATLIMNKGETEKIRSAISALELKKSKTL